MRKRLAFFLIFLLVAGALDALLAPYVVAHGVRFWISWAAKKEGLKAEIEEVDAPFLGPVTIRRLRLAPAGGKGPDVNLEAASAVLDLNLTGLLFGRGTAFLSSVEVDHLVCKIRAPNHPAAIRDLDWKQFAQLLPDNFRVGAADFDLTTATAAVSLRGLTLSGSAIESGKFFARGDRRYLAHPAPDLP